jgi:3-phosphoshikimate 1-carboxyvinyltransferase
VIIYGAKRVQGLITLPGDKSISHRAAMMAAIAEGISHITNYSSSADCGATLSCLERLGVQIRRHGRDTLIDGAGPGILSPPAADLDCANSGTTMRLLSGILAGHDFVSTLTGDASLSSRPMQRIIEPLEMMGAQISSHDGRAPLRIAGKQALKAIDYELLTASAQVKSCILLAGLNAQGRTTVIENEITRDHTERMLRWFGVALEVGKPEREPQNGRFAAVTGPVRLGARNVSVPGDISSAAYFIAAAALLPESSLEIADVGLNPTRIAFLDQLRRLGFEISARDEREENNEPTGTLRVTGKRISRQDPGGELRVDGCVIPQLIDELPLLAVVGSQIEGGIEIRDARELRVKESDRIAATVAGLRAMGCDVEEFPDGLRVSGPTKLRGAQINPHGDHRIAMSFTIAGLLAEGETEILDAECVAVSFPEFFALLGSVTD